ncbi:hypothetical protein [Thiolapillus brandeum]|uniref:Phosphoglycerate mutase n=1 Tax=Thiolapillus brandeum TaxID=1076588 RepID=A0A7U6GJH0_9GAMM|nr:hypothetical protein [Thiolapillus brandeum]BAO44705.1 hypothetical protein TBH_C1789 [Thiolapillus brandeum]
MTHQLLVPGLREAPPGDAGQEIPRHPLLERFIARADAGQIEGGLEDLLMRAFGLEPGQGAAPFCYLAETGKLPESGVLRAHPVHLRADRDRVLLFPLDASRLDMEEARQLAGEFNAHFSPDGLALEVVHPHHWYLMADELPPVRLAPLDQVAGRSLAGFLPDAVQGRFWLSVINETQMLFFQSPVNQAREQAGRLPVNGLWFDGAGRLPRQRPVAPAVVRGGHCLLRGLQARAEEARAGELTLFTAIQQALLEQDLSAWLAARQELEALLGSLMKHGQILLYSCDGYSWHWKPACRHRFWRVSRPLPWF